MSPSLLFWLQRWKWPQPTPERPKGVSSLPLVGEELRHPPFKTHTEGGRWNTTVCFHVILFVLPKQRTPSFQKTRTSMLGVEIFFLIVVLILLSRSVNFFTSWLSHLKNKHWRKTNQLREDRKNSPRARSMARIVQIFFKNRKWHRHTMHTNVSPCSPEFLQDV